MHEALAICCFHMCCDAPMSLLSGSTNSGPRDKLSLKLLFLFSVLWCHRRQTTCH